MANLTLDILVQVYGTQLMNKQSLNKTNFNKKLKSNILDKYIHIC